MENSQYLLYITVAVLLFNLIQYVVCLSRKSQFRDRWLLPVTWLGFAGLTGFILMRVFILNTSAIASNNQLIYVFSWSIIAIYLGLVSFYDLKAIGVMVLPVALLFMVLPQFTPDFSLLGPWTHIFMILLAYGSFTVSFLLAIGYLRAEYQLRAKSMDQFFFILPSLETMDKGLQRTIGFGLGFLCGGIGLGIIDGFMSNTIGIAWFTDPNIMGSIITVLIYGTIILIRQRALFTTRRIAYLTVLGFVFIIMLFVGMNVLTSSHHFVQQ